MRARRPGRDRRLGTAVTALQPPSLAGRTSGAWAGRPSGMPGAVPPPSVPLAFLGAAALGLVACGGAWVWSRGAAATGPTSDRVVAAVHFGVLAALSMGVLGAMHQFTPVISGKALRSVALARATFVTWLLASWGLPLGVATEQLTVTAISGALAGVAVVMLVVNFTAPLSVRGKGARVIALRFALAGWVLTCFLGTAFASDRQANWFDLSPHVDVSMAVLGLFGWLGTTYVGVAEKLWPMFMLAHLPGRHRAGLIASWALPLGAFLLAPGIAWSIPVLAWTGVVLLAVGLGAHTFSLWGHVQHRRRKADLHLVFLVTAEAWLLVGTGLALAAVVVLPRHYHEGIALAAGALAAFAGWLLEALVGHAHKVVPFILWSVLRSRGIDKAGTGKPLLFADLYAHAWAAVAYGSVTAGIAALCAGLGGSQPVATAVGGCLLAVTGAVLAVNLSAVSLRRLRRSSSPRPEAPAAALGRLDAKQGGTSQSPDHHFDYTSIGAAAGYLAANR